MDADTCGRGAPGGVCQGGVQGVGGEKVFWLGWRGGSQHTMNLSPTPHSGGGEPDEPCRWGPTHVSIPVPQISLTTRETVAEKRWGGQRHGKHTAIIRSSTVSQSNHALRRRFDSIYACSNSFMKSSVFTSAYTYLPTRNHASERRCVQTRRPSESSSVSKRDPAAHPVGSATSAMRVPMRGTANGSRSTLHPPPPPPKPQSCRAVR